jgi:hypothetical protein
MSWGSLQTSFPPLNWGGGGGGDTAPVPDRTKICAKIVVFFLSVVGEFTDISTLFTKSKSKIKIRHFFSKLRPIEESMISHFFYFSQTLESCIFCSS